MVCALHSARYHRRVSSSPRLEGPHEAATPPVLVPDRDPGGVTTVLRQCSGVVCESLEKGPLESIQGWDGNTVVQSRLGLS